MPNLSNSYKSTIEASDNSSAAKQAKKTGLAGVLARIYWMMAGQAILAVLALNIRKDGGEFGTLSDIAFLANLAGLVAVRYLDITRLGGQTTQGDPATLSDWRRFSIAAVAVWAVVFVVVHL